MTDVHTPEIRSFNMSRIKSKNTKPELIVRSFLFSKGFRYRLHKKNFPGKPDIVLSKYKAIIFIHGCFWHGHEGCQYYVIPETRTEWWKKKVYRTKQLDIQNRIKLEKEGWKIITIFECELKGKKINNTFKKLPGMITG
jgi:DNA mismatch endonuclease (patch repair protein)